MAYRGIVHVQFRWGGSGRVGRACQSPHPPPTHPPTPIPFTTPLPAPLARQVLQLVPTAAGRVLPMLLSNFPFKLRDRNIQCLYFRGLFALAEGRAGHLVRDALLAAAVEHLIQVDCEIRWARNAPGSFGTVNPQFLRLDVCQMHVLDVCQMNPQFAAWRAACCWPGAAGGGAGDQGMWRNLHIF